MLYKYNNFLLVIYKSYSYHFWIPCLQRGKTEEVSGQVEKFLQNYLKLKEDKVVALKTWLNPATVSTCSLLAIYTVYKFVETPILLMLQ